MDSMQALNKFWSEATGLVAYEEYGVPDDADIIGGYATYQTAIDSLDYPVFPLGQAWKKTTSWETLDMIMKRVDSYIGTGRLVPIDEGAFFVCKGSPFAQRMIDEDDSSIKGYLFNIQVEYLTA